MAQNRLRLKLNSIALSGFKSINKEGQEIKFQDVTIFLGPNGSGKSNLISFFKMLNYMMTGSLQQFVGESGTADSILHYGAFSTSRVSAEVKFSDSSQEDVYKFILSHAARDTLIFNEETLSWKTKNNQKPYTITLDPGLKESGLPEMAKKEKTARVIYALLRSCQVFQFHDTSSSAKLRQSGYINDNRFLRSDGGNLAAFLYALKIKENRYYQKILRYIKQVVPQFGDFDLYPSMLNENYILLNWKEEQSDYLFGPHQISDGSLRFMCLATLLLQPPRSLPSVIILDEPELGLHPSAISLLAGMVKSATKYCQVIMATQSPRLVDEFTAENIVIVERDQQRKCSDFHVLNEDDLGEWLERYSLSELWEKNVLGGQP